MSRASVGLPRAVEIIEDARRQGHRYLADSEGFALLEALGMRVPIGLIVRDVSEIGPDALRKLPGEQLVLKVSSPGLLHKSEVRGVEIVPRDVLRVHAAAERMAVDLEGRPLSGYLLQEWIAPERAGLCELLLSCRVDREFGPVVCVAAGGVQAEMLTEHLRAGRELAVVSLALGDSERLAAALASLTVVQSLTWSQRGTPEGTGLVELAERIWRFARRVGELMPAAISELEVNPLVLRDGELIALDVLVELADRPVVSAPPRPLRKLRRLLEPRSIALVGVSERLNVGRQILRNILQQGFDPARLVVVKGGVEELDGCRCVASLSDLSERVDLLVVAVAATGAASILRSVIQDRLAESVIVIPGGFGETEGSRSLVEEVTRVLLSSRASDWEGPIVNGGNCMGVRSVPGRYDTFFLPEYKLPRMPQRDGQAALIAQSGAFLAAKSSKMASIPLRYAISIGNQIDLTVGDYLQYLESDEQVRVVALYLEGLREGDGSPLLAAAERLQRAGRTVVLYRAGRSRAGRRTAASHTASIAGSYRISAGLARSHGVLLADTLGDFEDLVSLAVGLDERAVAGRRLAGASNAGFECVAFSDHLGWFEEAELAAATADRLGELLRQGGVNSLVGVRNPLDLTPMLGAELYSQVVESILQDPHVDMAVIGCVPLTGALETLPAAPQHHEDLLAPGAIARCLIALWQRTRKPWIVVVDAGREYDCLAEVLSRGGIPTFRNMDRAMMMLESYCRYRSQGTGVDAETGAQG